MAYSIKWSPKEASHFEGICDYITKDSRHYAILFAKKILLLVKSIPQFPRSGRIVPEYKMRICAKNSMRTIELIIALKKGSLK